MNEAENYDDDDADDELDWDEDAGEAALVHGFAAVLDACVFLREQRVSLGVGLDDVIARCECEPTAIEWVDEGDLAAPVEAFVYYAAAIGLRLRMVLEPAV